MWQTLGIAKAGKADEIARIERLVAGFETDLQKSFLETVRKLAAQMDLDALSALLQRGDVAAALRMVAAAAATSGWGSFAASITTATLLAGRATAAVIAALPPFTDIDVRFDVLNPATVQHAKTYEMTLIREMSGRTLQAVQATIEAGVIAGRNPFDIARDIKGAIGLTDYQAGLVERYRWALENINAVEPKDRAAARSAARHNKLRDKRSDPAVKRAIKDKSPLSPDAIDKMVERYRGRWLQLRAQTISRTEAMRAHNTGAMQAWRQKVADGTIAESEVRRDWIFTKDSKTRHAHRTIPALNPDGVGLNEHFKSELGPILYPLDPAASAENTINCRCTQFLRYVPSSQLAA